MQRWRFLVIQDAEIKRAVGAYYKKAWDEVVAPRYRAGTPAPGMSQDRFQRLLAAAEYLAAHIHEAPLWIVPCLQGDAPTRTAADHRGIVPHLLHALGAAPSSLLAKFEHLSEGDPNRGPALARP